MEKITTVSPLCVSRAKDEILPVRQSVSDGGS